MRLRAALVFAFGAVLVTQAVFAQEILVSAAASLTHAFRDAGTAFEARNPGARVTFNFAASDVLVTQIAKGAPADVLASADQEAMNRGAAADAIVATTRRDFAANALVLVVPVTGTPPAALADLVDERFRRIAMGSPQTVPAGRYAREAIGAARLWGPLEPRLVFAQNVRQVLDYVARAEAQAGFVYATDAAIMPHKVKVAFDVPTATPVRYPIAVVSGTRQEALARAFVTFISSAEGLQILRKHGFRAP